MLSSWVQLVINREDDNKNANVNLNLFIYPICKVTWLQEWKDKHSTKKIQRLEWIASNGI